MEVGHNIEIINNSDEEFEIVSFLYKWKVMYMQQLRTYVGSKLTTRAFQKKVEKLEKKGVLGSVTVGYPRRKIVFLGKDLAKKLHPEVSLDTDEVFLLHECLVAQYGIALEKRFQLEDVLLAHEKEYKLIDKEQFLTPDAIFFSKEGEIAFELELTQKSRTRIFEKFRKYGDSDYKYFIYLFNSKNLGRNYIMRAKEFEEKFADSEGIVERFREKMIFIYVNNDFSESTCLFQGRSMTLDKISEKI